MHNTVAEAAAAVVRGPGTVPDWTYETPHWAGMDAATTAITDVVSRKWLANTTSHDETSTKVQAVFTRAPRHEASSIASRNSPSAARRCRSIPRQPAPGVVGDVAQQTQMASGSARKFIALCWLATHDCRPGTRADQAWSESLFGHFKGENPHLDTIGTSPSCAPNSKHSANTGVPFAYTRASATSPPTRSTGAAATPSAVPALTDLLDPATNASSIVETTDPSPDPRIRTETTHNCDIESDSAHAATVDSQTPGPGLPTTSPCSTGWDLQSRRPVYAAFGTNRIPPDSPE